MASPQLLLVLAVATLALIRTTLRLAAVRCYDHLPYLCFGGAFQWAAMRQSVAVR
jgi:hypothetical protein